MASSKRNDKTAPVSAHPAFPVIVALWFAALFGLGSMVLPAALPEKIVAMTGLDAIVPALAPPLGIKARALIALAMTVVGVVLGLAVARKVARAQVIRPERGRNRVPTTQELAGLARRPISAMEELGDDLDRFRMHAPAQDQSYMSRRRPLAMTEEETCGPWVPDVPLPGMGMEAPEPLPEIANESPAPEPAPLELAPFADISAARQPDPVRAFAMPEPVRPVASLVEPAPSFGQPLSQPMPVAQEPVSAPIPADVVSRPLAELGVVELIERLALAMRNSQVKAVARPATGDAGHDRRELAVQAAEALSRFPGEAADEAVAASAPRPGEPPFPSIPLALRPLVFDEVDGEEGPVELPSFALRHESGMREAVPFTAPVPAFGPPVEDEAIIEDAIDEDGAADGEENGIDEAEGYSSLLKLKAHPVRSSEFVRIEEPEPECAAIQPVVVFPGHEMRRPVPEALAAASIARPFDAPGIDEAPFSAPVAPVDAGETERALRAALANLQRISGAA